jgi:hypothetical protein
MSLFKRVRLPGLLVGALALALVGCGGGGGGSPGPDAADAEDDFVVVQEIPTNGQQVSGKLEGVANNQISIEFSTPIDENTILDPTNPFNGLSANLTMLDNTLYRVPGTPEVKGKYFRFIPPSTGLTNQQYTLSVSKNVLSDGGQSLPREFYTSFTVGEDEYDPIVRRAFPVQNQVDVPRNSVVRVTFNESLDPASVNTQTVLVQDGGQSPPVAINGTISLENNGFEVVFTPDPWTGLPPGTTVVVTLIGGDSGIADKTAGRPFLGPGASHQWTLQFSTTPGGDPVNQFARSSCYFIDDRSWGVIDIVPYTVGLDPWQVPAVVGNNSRRKIGRPLDMVIDPRIDANGDTLAYVVDGDSNTVAVVYTFNSRIVLRLATASAPRGLAIHLSGQRLWISEFGADTLAKWDLTHFTPSAFLVGLPKFQAEVAVGRGPLGAACSPDAGTVFVVNSLEGTCSVVSQGADTVAATWQTGAYPQDVGVTVTFPGLGYFALASNLGADGEPGSASLWWSANPSVQQWLLAGMQNPKGVTYDWGINWYVANSGSTGVAAIRLGIQGNTIVPSLVTTFPSAQGPQNVALDPISAIYGFTSCRGDGLVTVFNVNDVSAYYPDIAVPGVKMVATLLNQ